MQIHRMLAPTFDCAVFRDGGEDWSVAHERWPEPFHRGVDDYAHPAPSDASVLRTCILSSTPSWNLPMRLLLLFCTTSTFGVRDADNVAFAQADGCTNVRVQGLIATAPNNSPNTDGMNFYGGHDQSIIDSVRASASFCSLALQMHVLPEPQRCVLCLLGYHQR